MTGKKRFTAGVLAAVIFFVMLFSVCYVAAETHHDCTGENCMICYQINACINTLKITVLALTAVALALSAIYSVVTASKDDDSVSFDTTLVSLKVKLSN